MRIATPMLSFLAAALLLGAARASLADESAPLRDLAVVQAEMEDAALGYDDVRLHALAAELEARPDVESDLDANRLRLRALFHEANLLRYRRKIQEHADSGEFKDRQVTIAQRCEAIAATVLEQHPDDVDLHVLLGEFLALQITGPNGAFIGPKAAGHIDRALELAPDDPDAHLAAGRRYLWTPGAFGGSDSTAIEHLEKAEKILNDRERELVAARKEKAVEGISDPEERKRALREMVQAARVEVWRMHEEVLIQLAIAYRRVGRDNRARVALKRALATNERSEAAKLLLARLDGETQGG